MLLIQGDRDPGSYTRYLRVSGTEENFNNYFTYRVGQICNLVNSYRIAFSGLNIYVMEIISRLLKSTAIIFMSP